LSSLDYSYSIFCKGCFIHRFKHLVPKLVLHLLKISYKFVFPEITFFYISLENIWIAFIVDLSSIILERVFTNFNSNCPLFELSRPISITSSNFYKTILIFPFYNSLLYILKGLFSKNPIGNCKSPFPNLESWIFVWY
jgi:hypothetical protein